MDGCLKLIRWLFSFLLSLSLLVITLVLPLYLGIFLSIRTPDKLKIWIAESGIYTQLVDIGVDEALSRTKEGAIEEGVGLEETEIRDTIKSVLEPAWLEKTGEEVLDGIYLWLNGKTPYPAFTIDLADRKDKVVEALKKLMYAKVAKMEVCGPEVEMTEEFNPFEAECIPPGVTREDAQFKVDQYLLELQSNENFLNDTKFEGSELKLPPDMLEKAPLIFKWLKIVALILISASILLPVSIILLTPNWRAGIVISGTIFLLSGLVNLVAGLSSAAGYRIAQQFINSSFERANGTFKQQEKLLDILFSLIENAIDSISKIVLLLGIFFLITAVVKITLAIVTREKKIES